MHQQRQTVRSEQQLVFGQGKSIERELQFQLGIRIDVHIELATWTQQHFELTGP